MARALTPKQRRFVDEYLVDLNATQAAIRAGHSEKTAYSAGPENLEKPGIKLAIDEALRARQARTEITQDWVLQMLRENVLRAMQRVPVLNDEGKPSGEWRYEGSVANKALELLGKHVGLFRERHDHSHNHVHTGPDGGPVETVSVRERITSRIAGLTDTGTTNGGSGTVQ